MRREAPGERPHRYGGYYREQDVGGVEGHFPNVADEGQQQAQKPHIEGRMRVPLHIDQVALEDITNVDRMRRLDLGVFGAGEIVDVVALNCLV
jgi:hypothetical protein